MHPQVIWWTQLRIQRWKQRKEKELEHSLVRGTSRVEGCDGALDATKKIDKQFNHSHGLAQTKQQVG
jgi:hypothetical protein